MIGYLNCELALEHGSQVRSVSIYLLINLINGSFMYGHVIFSTLCLVLSDLGTFIQEQLSELHCEETVLTWLDSVKR